MPSIRDSLRDSLRVEPRDYSLLAAAAILVLLGLGLSNHVIPNYHEQQTLEKRLGELQEQVRKVQAENERLADEALALEDPYYMAHWMVEHYRWRYSPMAESGHGVR